MTRFRMIPAGATLAILALGVLPPVALDAQERPFLPLRPTPVDGYPIIPFMEGWWDNGDGTITVSFGYLNRNESAIDLPIGPANSIEPAQFSGMQPTHFGTGRSRGIFTVRAPAAVAESGVWWRITHNGVMAEVPGRTYSTAYQLDFQPRPHGTVPPVIRIGDDPATAQWPTGGVMGPVRTVRVGQPLDFTVHAQDVSVRDPADRRFREPLDIALSWEKHQGPVGDPVWVLHPDRPLPPPPAAADSTAGRGGAAAGRGAGAGGRGGANQAPPADQFTIEGGAGTAFFRVSFPVAGDWVLRLQGDQFGSAPDSGSGDQCCWTNAFVRVRVTP